MDLIAALALVMVIEGLALAIMARSMPAVLASLEQISPQILRISGLFLVMAGAALYLLIR